MHFPPLGHCRYVPAVSRTLQYHLCTVAAEGKRRFSVPPSRASPNTALLSCVRFSGTFVGNAESTSPPPAAASPPAVAATTLPAVPTIPVVPTIVGVPNTVAESVLNPNEVKPPASGTRKARVLYDYEAADSTELALLADEVSTFPSH